MIRRFLVCGVLTTAVFALLLAFGADAARASGRGQPTDWGRFYYYPYVYYPHNFERSRGSYDHLYYRYGANQRIPVYRKDWYNFYPTKKPYHRGHHFILDVF